MDLSDLRGLQDAKGPKPEIARFRPISADSHVMEPANLYVDYMSPRFRDRAPRVENHDGVDVLIVEGAPATPVCGIAGAGVDPKDMRVKYTKFTDIDPGGWDAAARLLAQDADGVTAEVIFPSVGMVVSRIQDRELQNDAMQAYNRWLVEFCAGAPKRLFGVGQTAILDVDSAIADAVRIKEQGFKGLYMNGAPWTQGDFDDPQFDRLWAACIDLDLPICFHTFGARKGSTSSAFSSYRGTQSINGWHSVVRENQDVIGMFVYGGIFDRFPALKLVCVEADAGWAPHFMMRMDHMYLRHRYWMKAPNLKRMPSDYVKENVWLTFQDDEVAFQTAHLMNPARLMWANDFPHSDSTWPWSHSLLIGQTQGLSDEIKAMILHDNVKSLFKLDVD